MRALLLDTNKNEFREVDIPKDDYLDMYHELIGCRCIDVCRRKIGNQYFEIVLDDEGLFADYPIITGYNVKRQEPMLVGNLIIYGGVDYEGNFTPITDEGVKTIKQNAFFYFTDKEPKLAIDMDY